MRRRTKFLGILFFMKIVLASGTTNTLKTLALDFLEIRKPYHA
jgi:hypothetical protein